MYKTTTTMREPCRERRVKRASRCWSLFASSPILLAAMIALLGRATSHEGVVVVAAFVVVPPASKPASAGTMTTNNRSRVSATSTTALSMKKDGRSHKSLQSTTAALILGVAALFAPLQVEFPDSCSASPAVPVVSLNRASALTESQLLVDDAWREVTRQYFDRSYGGQGEEGWRQRRLEAVKRVANVGPDETREVYEAIRTMLSSLKDPYTRFLTPEQYETLTAYAKGGTSYGVGVQLAVDPTTEMVVVVGTVPDSPAARGGVSPGDVVVEVDGMDVQKATAEVVAAKCRGDVGTTVTLGVRRGGDGRPSSEVTRLSLTRAPIRSRSVESSVVSVDGAGGGGGNRKVGLVRVSSFSQETPAQVAVALDAIRRERPAAIALDLRGNAGGYMPAGVDVARLFLPPQSRIVSEIDKSDRATVYAADGTGGGSDTDTATPLFVIVDDRTASASEILAAALQDNRRAKIVGKTHTFGKGRIQNVQELQGGCGIAVTKARYVSPSGRDIQGVGIGPDEVRPGCDRDASAAACLAGLL